MIHLSDEFVHVFGRVSFVSGETHRESPNTTESC